MMYENNQTNTDHIALLHARDQFGFRQLSRDAENLAGAMMVQGVHPGDLVALVTSSSVLIARMAYASLTLGVGLFPLDPSMASARRNRLLLDSGCDLVITDLDLADLPPTVNSISVKAIAASDSLPPTQDWKRDATGIQLVIATSGSEGEPKGVMLSQENIAASVAASRRRLDLGTGDLWLCCLPLFHIGGVSILYRCLDAGAGMLLHQGFDAATVWQDIQQREVTHISLVPAMLARLLDISQDASPPERLRVALIGGGHLAPELARRAHAAGWQLCVSYGMSETASQCATRCGADAGLSPGEVGLPLDGMEIGVTGQGRIRVRGPAVMLGYINPRRTPGLGLQHGDWFETADLGEIDGMGRLRVLGRADDQLLSGGRSVHPLEVEDLITVCPGVDQVAIAGQPDQVWGVMMVALYTGSASAAEVERWCRDNIVSGLRPRRYIKVQELPLNTLGKLDRARLTALALQA